MKNLLLCLGLLLTLSLVSFGQTTAIEKSPAYRYLAAEKVKFDQELNTLRQTFRETHPDVQAKKNEIEVLDIEMAKLIWSSNKNPNRLTEDYGKLIMEKVNAESSLKKSLAYYKIKHPDIQQKIQAIALAEAKITEYLK